MERRLASILAKSQGSVPWSGAYTPRDRLPTCIRLSRSELGLGATSNRLTDAAISRSKLPAGGIQNQTGIAACGDSPSTAI